jgi:glyoxylase-like metal-dependent hydrolase (beta-lactamase superfamily II)
MILLPDDITYFERGWLSSNNFLLHDTTQACLVDTGYYSHAQQTEALVKSVLQDRPLTTIVNTHLHSDHCGGNAHLQKIYPNVQTRIPPGLAKYVANWDDTALTYGPTGQHCPPFSYSETLDSGDSFVVADREWTVFCAPGHDTHSVILFNASDRILISADALWENGFGVVFPELEGVDAFEEVSDTLDLIAQLQPKIVLPGHGQPFDDVQTALQRARSRLKQFTTNPEKHRDYAAKVLLKFKLLEVQKVTALEFYKWACGTPYLERLHKEQAPKISIDSWIDQLCHSLERSGACCFEDQNIVNT